MNVSTQALRYGVMILALCAMTYAQNGAAGKNIVQSAARNRIFTFFRQWAEGSVAMLCLRLVMQVAAVLPSQSRQS